MIKASGAVPILYETPAYRTHAKGSEELGTWEEFSQKQKAGYLEYKEALTDMKARISPVN